MLRKNVFCKVILSMGLSLFIAAAQADTGDDQAVAKAKMEYEKAMKSNDVGLQNAMKIQLSVQMAKSRASAEAAKEKASNGTDANKQNRS